MIVLQAPFDVIQTTTQLPNPLFDDSESANVSVNTKRSMTNVLYTTVKRSGRSILKWSFELSRGKALELRAFIESYKTTKIRITDHRNRVWYGYFRTESEEIVAEVRWQLVTLEFEGERII